MWRSACVLFILNVSGEAVEFSEGAHLSYSCGVTRLAYMVSTHLPSSSGHGEAFFLFTILQRLTQGHTEGKMIRDIEGKPANVSSHQSRYHPCLPQVSENCPRLKEPREEMAPRSGREPPLCDSSYSPLSLTLCLSGHGGCVRQFVCASGFHHLCAWPLGVSHHTTT